MESFTINPKCLNLPWLWWHWGTHCCPLHGEWWGRTDPCSDRPWAPHWTCKVKPWELPGRTGTHSWNFPVGSQSTSQSKPGWTDAQGKDYCRRAPEMHKMRTGVIKKDQWKNQRAQNRWHQTDLWIGIRKSTRVRPLLQQGVKDDVQLLLVVAVGYNTSQGGIGVRGGGNSAGQWCV